MMLGQRFPQRSVSLAGEAGFTPAETDRLMMNAERGR